MVAEDNLINQKVVRGMLDHFGCTTTIVQNGQEAIDAAQTGSFDIILLDVHMPEVDGLTAARAIRGADDKTIIALTADSLAENRASCEAAGMTGFLSKPLRRDQLFKHLVGLKSG